MSLDCVGIPSSVESNEDGTGDRMKKDQNTHVVCVDIHENHEMNSIISYQDLVSKRMSRPSRSQGSSNEDMSEKSALNSRHSETNTPTKKYSSYRYPYKKSFNFKKKFGKRIPVLSTIIGMRYAKEIAIVVSFIGLVMLTLYALKSSPTKGINLENRFSQLELFFNNIIHFKIFLNAYSIPYTKTLSLLSIELTLCPISHPFAFCQNGRYCCQTNRDTNGAPLTYGGCNGCEHDKLVECESLNCQSRG